MVNNSNIYRKGWIYFCGIVFLLCACKSYQFRESGFIVDGDGVYHNPEKYGGIGLFGDFVNYNAREQHGTRFDKLYPGDKKVLKSLGYNKGDIEVLFSGIPNQPPYYHLIGIGAKDSLLDTAASILQYTPMGKYHYRKMDVGKNTVLEAIIPSGKTNYALIYYVPKGESTADFEYLLEQNVRKPNRPHNFLASRTAVECGIDVQKNVDIKIPQNYVNRDIYTLIKVLKKEDYGESLAVYTLNKKDADPQVVFKLCPGKYRVVYSDLKHQEIWSEKIKVQ
ncbi:hypothetical protein [Sphingobacterium chuzhouense]|uniref:hypothetical protein n=1 Tax=Sphingobacterium chuzhouense TaxID=1742264 RepID=UPI0036D41101